MKWVFGIRRKISAALLLTAIFVLLFVKSMVDSNNVVALGNSFASVYEDRLLVESYIYRLSDHLFRKKIMIDTSATAVEASAIKPGIDRHNADIERIIEAYEKTKLTEDEVRYFAEFKGNIRRLRGLEEKYFERLARGLRAREARDEINAEFNRASINLSRLSGIQISEGKKLNEQSKKIVAGSSLLTRLELGILIAIGLMIMALIFESTSFFSKGRQDQRLN